MTQLSKVTRSVIKAGAVDPTDVAAAVYKRLTPTQRESALMETLRGYARVELGRARRGAFARGRGDSPPTQGRTTRKSWKTASAYAAQLRAPVAFGEDETVWKQLADCALDEVRQLASEATERAQQQMESAERYEKLAAAMEEEGARKVSDLSDDALGAIFD